MNFLSFPKTIKNILSMTLFAMILGFFHVGGVAAAFSPHKHFEGEMTTIEQSPCMDCEMPPHDSICIRHCLEAATTQVLTPTILSKTFYQYQFTETEVRSPSPREYFFISTISPPLFSNTEQLDVILSTHKRE